MLKNINIAVVTILSATTLSVPAWAIDIPEQSVYDAPVILLDLESKSQQHLTTDISLAAQTYSDSQLPERRVANIFQDLSDKANNSDFVKNTDRIINISDENRTPEQTRYYHSTKAKTWYNLSF